MQHFSEKKRMRAGARSRQTDTCIHEQQEENDYLDHRYDDVGPSTAGWSVHFEASCRSPFIFSNKVSN